MWVCHGNNGRLNLTIVSINGQRSLVLLYSILIRIIFGSGLELFVQLFPQSFQSQEQVEVIRYQ